MHEEVLPSATRNALEQVAALDILGSAYLAGGTAVALHLGHRISEDLDFFTSDPFDERVLSSALTVHGFELEELAWRTILGRFHGVKFSCFFYQYPLIEDPVRWNGVRVIDLRDSVAMKIEAIASRGTIRDFVDLYAIIQSLNVSLHDALGLYRRKYGERPEMLAHALQSLVYFVDADREEGKLKMLQPLDWPAVKRFFVAETDRVARRLLS